MGNGKITPKMQQDLLNLIGERLGKSPDNIKNAMQEGQMDEVLGNLKPEQAEKIKSALSDQKSAERLLSTPQARQLIKQIFGDKK